MEEKNFIASCSGGKDSVCMVIELIRRKYPLDKVLFVDIGVEFQPVYDVIEKVSNFCEENNVEFITLKPLEDFEYAMLHKSFKKRSGVMQEGYKWCGGKCRWATSWKMETLERYYRENCYNTAIYEYVGIAADEDIRTNKNRNRKHTKLYPLVEWGFVEKDCLEYCYNHDIQWLTSTGVRLYDLLDRVSCSCCRNKNLKELKNIYLHLPEAWQKLEQYQEQMMDFPFYKNELSIYDLEARFIREMAVENATLKLF